MSNWTSTLISFYSFSWNAFLKSSSHETSSETETWTTDWVFWVNLGKYVCYCMDVWILEERFFFYSAAGSSCVCSVHFLCLLFICYINSLKMSAVAICSGKVSGPLPGGGLVQSGDVVLVQFRLSWSCLGYGAWRNWIADSACFSSFPPINVASAQWKCIAKPQTLMKHRCSNFMSRHRHEKLFRALRLV